MAIPRRELRDHKCLSSTAQVSSYGFPRAMHPTSQHPPQASHSSLTPRHGQPTKRIDLPGSQTRAHRRQNTLLRRPDHHAATTLRRNRPRWTGPRAAPPRPTQHSARVAPIYPLAHRPTPSRRGPHPTNPITTTTHTHSPHPKTSTSANLTPPGQAAHLQPIRPSYSFAQGGSRDNRGWPGYWHSETATPQATPRASGTQTPPRRT